MSHLRYDMLQAAENYALIELSSRLFLRDSDLWMMAHVNRLPDKLLVLYAGLTR